MDTPTLRFGTPAEAGLSPPHLRAVENLLTQAVRTDLLSAAALLVARRGVIACHRAFGRTAGGAPLDPSAVFLTASLTKPIVGLAALQAIDAGRLRLADPARSYLPELCARGAYQITIDHLLTHTSGLPDMVPENERLRAAHAPLSAFVEATCRQPLAFTPGTGWQYQSMGILLLAAIVERIAGAPMPDLLEAGVFAPLGLADTVLGVRAADRERLVPVRLEPSVAATDWHWNSIYWRSLGAPWGGLHSTVADLAVILQTMLCGGTYGSTRILSPALAAAAVSNRLAGLPRLPAEVRRQRRWGLAWRLGGDRAHAGWPTRISPRAFGHTGATGTIFWADPDTDALMVLLTDRPAEHWSELRQTLADEVAAAVV